MGKQVTIPEAGSDKILRNVNLGDTGYRLLLWDTYRTGHMGKSVLGYAFYEPNKDAPLFSGEDFGCGMSTAIDSDEALRSLLGFLTLRPGDTDKEYFFGYTDEQMAFAEGEAEQMQDWGTDPRDVDDPEEHERYYAFVDVE